MIEEFGNPLLNTSALRDDHDEPVVDAFDVEKLFGHEVDLIIDGGEVFPNPSTVISLISEQPEILREGKGDITPFLLKTR